MTSCRSVQYISTVNTITHTTVATEALTATQNDQANCGLLIRYVSSMAYREYITTQITCIKPEKNMTKICQW